MKKAVLYIIGCLISFNTALPQVMPDSLNRIIIKAETDSSNFKLINQAVIVLISNADTARRDLFIKEALKVAQTQGREIQFLEFVARIFEKNGDYFQALDYYAMEMKSAESRNNKAKQAFIYKQIGNIYYNLGDFGKAIDYHFKCLRESEQLKDSSEMAAAYNNIGKVYSWQGDMVKALEYYNRSLAIDESRKNYNGISGDYNNLGFIFENSLNYDTALIFYRKSLEISRTSGNDTYLALAFTNLANIYNKTGLMDSSLFYYQSALNAYQKLGDKRNLAEVFLSVAKFHNSNFDNHKAEEYFKKAFELSKEIKSSEIFMDAALGLSEVYSKLGDFRNAYEYHVLYKKAENVVKNESTMKIINQRDMKYLLDNKIAEQIAEKKRQAIKTFFFLFALTFMIILAIVIYSSYRRKRRDNLLLAQQKEEIETQRDEIEAQRDQVTNQRDQIQKQKEEITDSILYARRIQNAVMPPEDFRKMILPEHFILNKPRDIVSGDFYWMGTKNDKIIALAADCTGHGVPGAFMSMLGVSFLNEIVNKSDVIDPGQILNVLRENIIRALHQTGKEGENKDGMDISLSVIDYIKGEIHFAGAYNPLYILRGSEVLEIKADRMPIGIYLEKNDKFQTQVTAMFKGDVLYMLSDGYVDQFGGPEGKKLKAKPFKELLLTLQGFSMEEQRQKLDDFNKKWMEGYAQIDDILVVGIRV
jgi:serine phosphatase RsbU (regulator of sigma subunit)